MQTGAHILQVSFSILIVTCLACVWIQVSFGQQQLSDEGLCSFFLHLLIRLPAVCCGKLLNKQTGTQTIKLSLVT
jgi:hypothetical protein